MIYLLDTGPLVAYLNKSDVWHTWVTQKFNSARPPFYTCEAVITETTFLLLREGLTPVPVFDLIERGDLIIRPIIITKNGLNQIQTIIKTYHDLPASFADACLVTMHMNDPDSRIFTLDRHFHIYRAGRKKIQVISPF